ncbi:hypothetical protein C2S52_020692 [Perilla frutescens var. hirtella]|nr:hypothetical protein C2S52_020692 [Perilla frutescens var. hirtella]KAH6805177.1 hypothetical protein C2S51_030008 [Perilla frutescens var. frutescens]
MVILVVLHGREVEAYPFPTGSGHVEGVGGVVLEYVGIRGRNPFPASDNSSDE